MAFHSRFLPVLAGIASLFASCHRSASTLAVKSRNFGEVVSPQQNLVFAFSHALAPDTLVQQARWDTTRYLAFEPRVAGRFRWNSPTELVFSPLTGFAPSTGYKVQLAKPLSQLAERTGKSTGEEKPEAAPSSLSDQVFTFHTPYLQLEEAQAVWTKSGSSAEPTLQLRFNYPVRPADVAKHLVVKAQGGAVSAVPAQSAAGPQLSFRLDAPETTRELPLEVTLTKGLQMPAAKGQEQQAFQTDKDMQLTVTLPSRQLLEVLSASADYDQSGPVINVVTNQTLAEGQSLKDLVSLSPAVPFEVQPTQQGLRILGEFNQGTTYQVQLSGQLLGLFGNKLGEDFRQYVVFGDLEPALGFVAKKGYYLTSKGAKNIGLQITSVPKVKVTVYKIYRNNILAFMREGNRYYQYESDYGDYGDYADYALNYTDLEGLGSKIYERTYETARLPKAKGLHLLNLSFDDITGRQGFYIIQAESSEDQWVKERKVVSVSDIGLTVRETPEEVLVFANSIFTAEPLPKAQLSLISTNNQLMARATTDEKGVAHFKNLKSSKLDFTPGMVTAQMGGDGDERGTDFNYLIFRATRIETSRYDVGGARRNLAGYRAFVYGDRDIYRPGETMHLNTLLRSDNPEDPVGMAGLDGLPLKLRLLLPNGREYRALRGKLNSQGAFATDIPLPAAAVTGTYSLEVLTANDLLLTSKSVSVEEFIPDRIKVELTAGRGSSQPGAPQPVYSPGESVTPALTATNLFGPPAAFRNYQMQLNLKRKLFSPKNFEDYTFDLSGNVATYFPSQLREGKTDEKGQAQESFQIDAVYTNQGLLEGNVFATVFDETGRPVNRVTRFEVATQTGFLGVRTASRYVTPGQATSFDLVALSAAGKPLNGMQAQVQVVHHNWQTVVEMSHNGQFRYLSRKKEELVEDRTLTIRPGGSRFAFVPKTSGEYELRLRVPGAQTYVSYDLYAYGYGQTSASAFEVNKEGQVTMTFNKDKYQVGEKAKVLFKTPFAGRLLVTVERDRVLEHYQLSTDKKSAALTLDVKDAYLPNVYITATLIRPSDDSDFPLTVAHGFAPLPVEKAATVLPVQITAAASTRSQTRQTITVKSRPEADIQVTVAVVDEGILQLKDYKTPDPHGHFYQKRALEVNAYDLYASLLPELRTGSSSTGGDGYDLARRVNPLTNKRVKLVSFWSGILRTNARGEVKYTVDIPQFSGQLRVMAVAYKGDAFGSASQPMIVADPLVLSTGLPRFASPGDTMLVPLTVSNTTAQPAQVTARLQTKGQLQVVGSASQTLALAPNSEGVALYRVVAAPATGTASLTATVQGTSQTFTETNDLTIRPVTSLVKRSGSGELKGGQNQTLTLAQEFIPATATARLVVSRLPFVKFSDDLSYLVNYPYGCLEQTVSAAFPQLYYPELVQALRPAKGAKLSPTAQVQEAIRKAEGLQLHNGGLAMWPGLFEEQWFASAYAAHFLYEAQQAGYEVNQQVLDRLHLYLAQQVKGNNPGLLYYRTANGSTAARQIVAKEVAYTLYVLAQAGKPERAVMNRYKPQVNKLTTDSKYLLAAAYLLLGDRTSYQSLLPASFSTQPFLPETGGSLSSAVRDMGLVLYTLVQADPQHAQVPQLARRLSEQLLGEKNFSTQERIWPILAFGKMARQAKDATVKATVSSGGRTLALWPEAKAADGKTTTGNAQALVLTKDLTGQPVTVTAQGNGTLYYFWETSGLLNNPGTQDLKQLATDQGLQIRRTYLDRNGNEISSGRFRQNDLVVVRLNVKTAYNVPIENVVLTDMLPAASRSRIRA